MKRFLQQGDVLVKGVGQLVGDKSKFEGIPKTAKPKKDNHVAEGEVTGHFHDVVGEGAEVLEEGNNLYIHAPNGGELRHRMVVDGQIVPTEEHHTIQIPPGDFQVQIVQEYDHFAEEARRVAD